MDSQNDDDDEEAEEVPDECYSCGVCDVIVVDNNETCPSCDLRICARCSVFSELILEMNEFGTEDENVCFAGQYICINCLPDVWLTNREHLGFTEEEIQVGVMEEERQLRELEEAERQGLIEEEQQLRELEEMQKDLN